MRKIKLSDRTVDVSKFSVQHQHMIGIAFGLLEFTLAPERTPIAIAEQGDVVSERLWEIALERHRQHLA